jgi:tetratricopeptide (TPR) repeat protein
MTANAFVDVISSSSMPGQLGTIDASAALKGQRVAFTGRLAALTRREAQHLVDHHGGEYSRSVNRLTTLLVVGMDGWPLLADGRMSNKLQQAEKLRERRKLRICSEQQFLESIGHAERSTQLRKCYEADQVAALVGIDEPTLRRWEALGLVRSHDDQFDFQDLVSLRTIASLIKSGVNPNVISRSMRQLAAILPGTDRPLAQLKIVAQDCGSLLAEIDGLLVTPAGQFLMPFDRQLGVDSAASIPLSSQRSAESAHEWFAIAADHEDSEAWDDAIAAYRRALAIQPHFAEANFNLANVLRAACRHEAAEERYRVAIEQNGQWAEAWFNLADLLDDQNRTDEAIDCLRESLRCSPHYADAHFNLAQCLEKAGMTEEAREHWRLYLKLDSTSEWAVAARTRLAR